MKKIFYMSVFFLFINGIITGQTNPDFPRLEPDPRGVDFARTGQAREYTWNELLDMGLWASGAAYSRDGAITGDGAAAKKAVEAAVSSLGADQNLPLRKQDQGDYLLNFMHRQFLKTYVERQTRLDLTVTTGRYNCVSSAVLYAILASSVGLETRGVLTKDHAFAQVNTGDELVDVETTNRYGYNPGSRKEFQDNFGNTTGFAYVAPQNYRDRSTISQLELVSLIMSNRIADLESRGRFGEAVAVAVDRAALLSMRSNPVSSPFFSDPKKDVADRVFNYGASLIKANKEEDALNWAAAAEPLYPDPRWREFNFAAMNNLLVKLTQTKKTADARIILDREASRFAPADFGKLDALVTDAELFQVTTMVSNSEDAEKALEIISQAAERGLVPEARIQELRNFVLLKEAERRSKSSGLKAAMEYLESASGTYGSNQQLQNALRIYNANRAIELHNQFAGLFNSRKYDEAYRHIQNALQEYPGDRQLLSDLAAAERALKQ